MVSTSVTLGSVTGNAVRDGISDGFGSAQWTSFRKSYLTWTSVILYVERRALRTIKKCVSKESELICSVRSETVHFVAVMKALQWITPVWRSSCARFSATMNTGCGIIFF